MKRKNMISMVTSLALVGVVAVGGTLALLSTPSNNLKNTFTVGDDYDQEEGNPDFILQEHVVKQDSNGSYVQKGDGSLTDEGQNYIDLVSNSNLAKDPYFTLRNADEDEKTPPTSWVVAKMDARQVKALNDANITFADAGEKWYLVTATATGEAGEKTWTYSAKDAEGDFDVLTAADLNNLDTLTSENQKFYFIYKDKLTAEASTTALFKNLSVGEVAPSASIALDIKGVAVQAVASSSLESNLGQIMEAAVSKLG